ncbi:2996_t:CDS:10 [Diversispora eburnea]|uniref:2996_t:CDS:1 n=1 Tax=Diversispora eburnea TaxID=1213867 RepID=A0A9N8VKK9_9GLOM|nr:2996_t:CDS:10 [Diversispora eburnea]
MFETFSRIEQSFLLSFHSRKIWLSTNIEIQRSILLFGPSGIDFLYIHCPKLFSLTIGDLAKEFPAEKENGLGNYFLLARNNQPSVLLLENIELFFPADNEPLLSFYFCELLENFITQDVEVLIVGTTTNLNSINPIARTIFQVNIFGFYIKDLDLADGINIKKINEMCHGFIAADIVCLCRMASEMVNIRSIEQTGEPGQLKITNQDFKDSFKKINISSLQKRNNIQKVESVKWEQIGGLNEVKKILEESVIWIYKHADAFRRLGIKPSKGVLLYGPPGTGKTLLAKAVSTESSAHFIPVSIPDLIKSEKAIENIFKIARQCSPCIIFLDELEALFGNREFSGGLGKKLISQLLLELDQLDTVDQGIVILSATNSPGSIDPSLLRPGRLDRLVYVQPPNFKERKSILTILSNTKIKISNEVNLDEIANRTENFTGADIKGLLQRAALLAIKRCKKKKSSSDNKEDNKEEGEEPSISCAQLEQYQKFEESIYKIS